MKMIIALDKICLIGIIGISLRIGYKAGIMMAKMEGGFKKDE